MFGRICIVITLRMDYVVKCMEKRNKKSNPEKLQQEEKWKRKSGTFIYAQGYI